MLPVTRRCEDLIVCRGVLTVVAELMMMLVMMGGRRCRNLKRTTTDNK